MRNCPDLQPHSSLRRTITPLRALAGLALLGMLAGCEAGNGHRVLNGLVNGMPEMPSLEEYCGQYQRSLEAAAAAKKPAGKAAGQTMHPPYGEKRCNDCHNQDRDVQGGLVAPRHELCFICHPDILKEEWTHGPAQAGDCLACHVPHSSAFPALLDIEPTKICERCHAERRRNPGMHDLFRQKLITCIECHDPHSGSNNYFLK